MCSFPPPPLPRLSGFLGDLGSIPSPSHLQQAACSCVQAFPVPVGVRRMWSCEWMLRSPSSSLRVAFQLLKSFFAFLWPFALPSLPCSVTLME